MDGGNRCSHRTFAILDVVGITTAYINKMEAEKTDKQK
jgi:hypothetical protein